MIIFKLDIKRAIFSRKSSERNSPLYSSNHYSTKGEIQKTATASKPAAASKGAAANKAPIKASKDAKVSQDPRGASKVASTTSKAEHGRYKL